MFLISAEWLIVSTKFISYIRRSSARICNGHVENSKSKDLDLIMLCLLSCSLYSDQTCIVNNHILLIEYLNSFFIKTMYPFSYVIVIMINHSSYYRNRISAVFKQDYLGPILILLQILGVKNSFSLR